MAKKAQEAKEIKQNGTVAPSVPSDGTQVEPPQNVPSETLADTVKKMEAEKAAAELKAQEEAEAKAQAEEQARLEAEAAKASNSSEGSQIAEAIKEGLKSAKGDNFVLAADEGVIPRFSLVRNKATGDVLLRENETGHLSQLQLKSIEEKESSLQDQEVEDL